MEIVDARLHLNRTAFAQALRPDTSAQTAGQVRVLRQLVDMDNSSTPNDLSPLATEYGLSLAVLEDLYARRRAGARDAELINLLAQEDRGGLRLDRAREVIAALPAR
jgi:hypothetical protein